MSCLTPTNPNSHTLLQQLHWLLIEYSINFKIANIIFNTLHYSQPAYTYNPILCLHTPACFLRSSDTNLLTIPFAHTAVGARSFSVASPEIWNPLRPALRSCNCPDTFRRHLKTRYFQQASILIMYLLPCAIDSVIADIVRVYKFHLLNYLL